MLTRILMVASLALAGGLAAAGCGSSSNNGGGGLNGSPAINNINAATTPTATPGQTIEINGTNFGSSPGTVTFTEGTSVVNVSPTTSGAWTTSNILVTVPSTLAAPGSASVTVTPAGATPATTTSSSTSGSTSAPVILNVISAPTAFGASNVTWASATPLPTALRAHAAAATPGTATLPAQIFVIGGNTGTANISSVLVGTLDAAGNVGTWQTANALPQPRAFAATAEADATNSLVSQGNTYVYVVGGQQTASDAPGGTSTVFIGTVTSGQINWITSLSALPEARTGASAVVHNGFLLVTGGLGTTGTPIAQTASAKINPDGTLGTFTENTQGTTIGSVSNVTSSSGTTTGTGTVRLGPSNLPTPVAYHQSFAQGVFLYVLGGNASPDTIPFSATTPAATATTYFAPVRNGVVGSWTQTGSLVRPREKFVALPFFNQVLVYEGAYSGTTLGGETLSISPSGGLSAFTPLPSTASPGLDVFNAAGGVSSVLTSSNQPRFLILGGDRRLTPGTLSRAVSRGGP